MVQLSHLYMTMGKTIALTIQTNFVGKVMSLLFNILSRFAIAFLPGSKCLLISWLQPLSRVIWEPKKRKSVTIFTFSSSICHEVMGPNIMIFVFFFHIEFQASFFTVFFYPYQEALSFLFTFCHESGIICISEVVDFSASNFDSSL